MTSAFGEVFIPLFGPDNQTTLFRKLDLSAAIRHDRYSDFGAATTALAAYSYRVATDWKMLGQVSNAFRAPSFNDLYFPGFGNPALLPERARSVEWGVQYARGRDFLRAALYRNRISDLIVFDPFIAIANNVAAARITGLELSGKTTLASWDLSANLTLQRPIDAQTGQRLLRRAAHNLNLGAAHNWERWRFLAELQRAGDRFDSDINTFARVSLAPFTLTNFSLATALNKNLDLTLALRNAFAAHYRLVDGYNNPGRVVLVTVSAKM